MYLLYTNTYCKRNINVFKTKRKTHSYLLQRTQRIAGRHWQKERTVKKESDFIIVTWEKEPSDKYTV